MGEEGVFQQGNTTRVNYSGASPNEDGRSVGPTYGKFIRVRPTSLYQHASYSVLVAVFVLETILVRSSRQRCTNPRKALHPFDRSTRS